MEMGNRRQAVDKCLIFLAELDVDRVTRLQVSLRVLLGQFIGVKVRFGPTKVFVKRITLPFSFDNILLYLLDVSIKQRIFYTFTENS